MKKSGLAVVQEELQRCSSNSIICSKIIFPRYALASCVANLHTSPLARHLSAPSHLASATGGMFLLSRLFSSSSGLSQAPQLKVVHSKEHDINFNLALEQYLMERCRAAADVRQEAATLFLWRNDKTVVIGRNQNPWRECNLQAMQAEGVCLARRYSGGGAVYQDLGNTCFTFLHNGMDLQKERNTAIILAALKLRYGIDAEASGRNDLTVNGYKFSGSAYAHQKGASLHHGTILLEADLMGLARCLTPHPKKLQSKGVGSVSQRVMNLKLFNQDITHEGLCDSIVQELRRSYGCSESGEPTTLTVSKDSAFTKEETFQKHLRVFTDWNWRYGKTPQFDHLLETRFDWGFFEVHLNVREGCVANAKIFSDCLNVELVQDITSALVGRRYTDDDISTAMDSLTDKSYDTSQAREFGRWLSEELRLCFV